MRKPMMLGVVCLVLYPAMVAAATPEEGKTGKLAAKAKVEHKTKDTTHTKSKTQAKAVTAYKRPIAPLPMPASELALEQDQKMVAEQVHTGRMACELGNSVYVSVDAQNPGHFHVQMNKHTFHMSPVVSATGAIRLEDNHAGAMWLQLSNKSMLMNSKLGQRMADECQSPDQMAVAEAMKLAPPVSLLEGLNTGAGLAKK